MHKELKKLARRRMPRREADDSVVSEVRRRFYWKRATTQARLSSGKCIKPSSSLRDFAVALLGSCSERSAISMNPIEYRIGNDLDLDEVITLYRESTLGERRPVDNRRVMHGMMESASLIVTAWDERRLIGIARTLTDFVYVAYLADLAVHLDYQKKGIGTELISRTREELQQTCSLTLLSAPKANDFYPRVGFYHNPRAWCMEPLVDPKESALTGGTEPSG